MPTTLVGLIIFIAFLTPDFVHYLYDGSYIGGALAWYNTDLEETANRDFVLAPPLVKRVGGINDPLDGFQRVILSAKDVRRLYVTWIP